MAAPDNWVNATMSLAGVSYPTLVSNAVYQRNLREVLIANGTSNALFGYAPGQARSGFDIKTLCWTDVAAVMLNAMLTSTGIAIAMQYGAAGGAANSNCFITSLSVDGAENGDVSVTASFDTLLPPTMGGTVATPSGYGPPFFFSDLTSVVLPGGAHTKIKRFSYKIMRMLSQFYGNSPYGLPQLLKNAKTTVQIDAEYLKLDDSEGTAAIVSCPTIADCIILLTEACPPGADPVDTLTLKALGAKHHNLPVPSGSAVTDFISESATVMSEHGNFSIA